jgi:DNA polymerase V
LLGITGLKTFNDLKGVVIDQLDLEIKDKQNIGSSRSFSQPALLLETLNSALSNYVMLATQKLRKQGLYAQAIQVYLSTNRHRKNTRQYQNSLTLPLISPSNHTGELIGLAKTILKVIYRSGYHYQKVGVLLLDLTKTLQTDLFTPINNKKDNDNLMLTLDTINKKMGNNSLFFAAQGIDQHWKSKRDYQSPHYTTKWEEIPSVI